MMNKKPSKVFISYSWDSIEYSNNVLQFSNRLRKDGIDANIDQYEECPAEGWPMWMDKEIINSDYVLILCSENYCKKVMQQLNENVGLGVKWEGKLIYQHLYNSGMNNKKFIPIILDEFGEIKYIPVPLQSYTHYSIPKDYDKLYMRLVGKTRVEKPKLGNQISSKERKTDVGFFVTDLIDLDLWDNAGWKGVGYIYDYYNPPFLGLLFNNLESALNIFKGWRKRLGEFDNYNELRISIIEGDIPGKESGYSVHLSAYIHNIIKRADENGIAISKEFLMLITRLHRMNPAPGSDNLKIFKQEYKKFACYNVIPMIIDGNNKQIQPLMDHRIVKKSIEFRTVEDIKSKDDLDSILLPKYRTK